MAKRNKLLELEQQHGNLESVIPPLVNEGGQKLAADKLDTSQNTISRWLREHGYQKVTRYERPERQEQPS